MHIHRNQYFSLLLLTGLLFVVAGCGFSSDPTLVSVKPITGSVVTEIRNVPAFTGVDVGNAIQVNIVRGTTAGLTLEAKEGYMPYVTTTVQNGVLQLRVDNTVEIAATDQIKATLTMNALTLVRASGAAQVSTTVDFAPATFTAELTGASQSTIPLTATAVSVSGSGASTLTLTGTAQTLTVTEWSGASQIKAVGLNTNNCSLNLSGASGAEVAVTTSLTVKASGASQVRYRGNPTLVQDLSGASTVTRF